MLAALDPVELADPALCDVADPLALAEAEEAEEEEEAALDDEPVLPATPAREYPSLVHVGLFETV